MQAMAICPKCRTLLTADAGKPNIHSCPTCSGQFIRRGSSLDVEPEFIVKVLAEGETALSCPDCLASMDAVETNGQAKFHCAACGGIWSEGGTSPTVEEIDKPVVINEEIQHPGFVKSLLYGISLPERIMRSAVGMTAGTAREAAQLMVPKAFQTSKSYEVAITNSLNFLTDTIGGFDSQKDDAVDAGEHLAKKAIGNFVDMAGMATLHVSPMWILAAVSDVAYGSSTYLKELAVELEKQGIIDKSSTIHNVDDILDAIQNTSGNMASSFDKPPLSVQELRDFVAETRESASQAKIQKLLPESEMRQYWESLHATATQENISPFEAATAVAMHTAQQASTITMTGVTGVKVAGSLLQRNVLQHYQDSLVMLREEGFLPVLQSTYQPYVGQVWNNFSGERKSWTESILDPGNIMKFFK
jgi:Zn-finger nucleic acid-binding protein